MTVLDKRITAETKARKQEVDEKMEAEVKAYAV